MACIRNKNQASIDPSCDGRKIGSVSLAANKSAMKERERERERERETERPSVKNAREMSTE